MNTKEQFPADSKELRDKVAQEKISAFLPKLIEFYDIFGDRSIMGNSERAKIVADQFTVEGVKAFRDFADALMQAKGL